MHKSTGKINGNSPDISSGYVAVCLLDVEVSASCFNARRRILCYPSNDFSATSSL